MRNTPPVWLRVHRTAVRDPHLRPLVMYLPSRDVCGMETRSVGAADDASSGYQTPQARRSQSAARSRPKASQEALIESPGSVGTLVERRTRPARHCVDVFAIMQRSDGTTPPAGQRGPRSGSVGARGRGGAPRGLSRRGGSVGAGPRPRLSPSNASMYRFMGKDTIMRTTRVRHWRQFVASYWFFTV